MAETTYTYNVATETANGQVQSSTLTDEINAAAFGVAIVRIDITGGTRIGGGVLTGGTMDVVMDDPVNEITLDGIVAAHQGVQILSQNGDDPYDNSNSTLTATSLSGAIDELDTNKASTSHASTHIQGGSDEIDADQLDIDFTPSTYVPTTAPPEVTDLDHLSAHLAGIDAALGSTVSNDKTVRVSADDTTPGFLEDKIASSTNISLVTLNPAGNEQLQISATGLALDSTQIIAGAGLTGGGNLSTDRTLDVVANADGSIVVNANDIQVGVLASDAQHGNRGGGSLHAEATTSVAGFLSSTDKTKLDGIEAGAQVNTVDSVFGRTGAVVALTSDYDAIQIDFTPDGDITATNVQAAIVEIRDDTDTKLTGKADVTHAATHIQGGSDEIDGDQLDIDFTPNNYTPATTPPEVTDVDQLSAHLFGIDTALGSVGGSIDIEDDDTLVASGISTLNFGDSLTVTDDGGGQVTIDGENAGRAVFTIWAEENASLSNNTYEWAFGNGADTVNGSGIPVPIDCVLFAVGLDHATSASATVAVEANGVEIATVTTSNQRRIVTQLPSPVNVTQGQSIGFRTVTGSGSGSSNRVVAYFRTAPFGAGAPVDSVFGRTGAVSAQTSDYDAIQVDFTPNGDIAASNVQAAIVEVRDDTDTKLTSKANTTTQIIAGAGLTGGGDLSTNRTLNVVAANSSIVVNADNISVGVITDSQHGTRGGGTLHANATTSVAGFLSATDKTKLDGIETGATADQNASEVPFTPNGDITSTNVQNAIVEVRNDTDTKLTGKASTSHAATHIQGGSDEIDGDQLDIDFTPSNYTPSTSPTEVTDVDQLSAHLAGIDAAIEGADVPILQLRLAANIAATGGFSNILWPNVDIENEPTVISRDAVNTERIVFGATGLYIVSYSIDSTFGGSDDLQVRAVLNDTTVIDGSQTDTSTGAFTSGDFTNAKTFVVNITTPNDYITIQENEIGTVTILAESTVVVRRLRGAKGEKGDPGAGGTITVQEEGGLVNSSIDTLNFIGSTVTATDAGGGVANITVSAAPSGADGDAFSAYDSAGTQSSTGTLQVNIDTEQFASSSNYSLAADTVTVVAAGRYIVSYECTLIATGGGRSQVRTFLEVNSSELSGSSASLYLRQNDYGATGSANVVVDLSANSQITLNATVTAGSPTYSPLVNSSTITIVRLT
jgi:hypothetical protein